MKKQIDKKEIIFNNISFILKKRKIKIGDFENAVGVSLGYVARALKSPTISFEFVLQASKFLNISIDDLINKNFQDGFLLEQINSLINNSISERITHQQKEIIKNLLIKLYNDGILRL